MVLVGKIRIVEFLEDHPDDARAIGYWCTILSHHDFDSFEQLLTFFPLATKSGRLVVFRFVGSNCAIQTKIRFSDKRVLVHSVS